jgi:mannose-6-phosphate isomerase-like protein (cupin superfamily)
MNILLKKISRLLVKENTKISLEIKSEIDEFILQSEIEFPRVENVLEAFGEISSLLKESSHELAEEIIANKKTLVWRKTTIPSELTTEEISNMFFVCPIMGPNTFISSNKFRLGFIYQRPNCYYPLHNHNAVETYAIVAGKLNWTDGKMEKELSEGHIIQHPKLLPHAFKTKSAGFLGMWHWSGDISPNSYKVLE